MTTAQRAILVASARVYRAACSVYPEELLRRFGDEMQADFEESCRAALVNHGAGEALRALAGALLDVACNAPPAWFGTVATNIVPRAAFGFMLAVLPAAMLLRVVTGGVPDAELWGRLAGLTLHCAVAALFAIATRRYTRATIGLTLVTAAALAAASVRGPVGTFQFAAVEALRVSLPVAVVLTLATIIPIAVRTSPP